VHLLFSIIKIIFLIGILYLYIATSVPHILNISKRLFSNVSVVLQPKLSMAIFDRWRFFAITFLPLAAIFRQPCIKI